MPETTTTPETTPTPDAQLEAAFTGLEAEFGARVGVYAVDTGTGAVVEHRADERFAHASTIKVAAVAAVLDAATPADLDEAVPVPADGIVTHSPVTAAHAGGAVPLREVLAAALTVSDNTAGNLLLDRAGGPAGLQAFLRTAGDDVTRVDRREPDLNTAVPGDPRDTTTPRALAADLRAFAVDDALGADDRAVLTDLLRRSTTGAGLVRAGVPAGWGVEDKSGTGGYGTRNDAAVVRPPGRAPLVVVVMSSRPGADAEPDDALLARATEVVVTGLPG
ncbi:class A beta-lactamase [Kineosporiaceae bacterium B12]|nr:class A beta-lactamase [Kineococcus rubinsiae]